MLISTLYPDVQRIDGTGGDDGRDVQMRTTAGLLVYELKSFTGRVSARSPKRRSQVESSLERAALLGPVAWTLVVPVDPNPSELEWFDKLRGRYEFPLEWRGRTWLDQQMAEHPAIARYFLADGYQEVYRLQQELKDEESPAAVTDVHSATQRMNRLADRLREADPFYRYDIRLGADGSTGVVISPAYAGAEGDRPWRIQLQGPFPDTPEGRAGKAALTDAIEFGATAVLGPEHNIGVALEAPSGRTEIHEKVAITISPVKDEWTAAATLRVKSPDGRMLASLPVRLHDRAHGTRGGFFEASDVAGAFKARFRVDAREMQGTMTFNYSEPEDVLPAALLPALRLLEVLAEPNVLVLDMGNVAPGSELGPIPLAVPPMDAGYVRLIEALSRIQDATRTPFPVPDELRDEEVEAIARVDRLLRGEPVEVTWSSITVTFTVTDPEHFEEALERTSGSLAMEYEDHAETICGHTVPIGRVQLILRSCRLTNSQELFGRDYAVGEEVEVTLEPADSSDAVWQLL